ncbi:MAG TPA: hypothetical protein VFU65_12595 [Actinocrinis sp.]|nr:hypothetical protein [Actinocrinis sp.]
MTDRRRAREEQGTRRAPKSDASRSADNPTPPSSSSPSSAEDRERDRRVRRARFLADLAEARELRKRVAPRRARAAELQARVLRTFRY